MKKLSSSFVVLAICSLLTNASAQFDVSPNSLTVQPESGSSTFSVNSSVGWSVSDDATWLTATKTDGSTITVNYDTNTSTGGRTAYITATGTGGVTETVSLYQEVAYIDFTMMNSTVSASEGSEQGYVSTSIAEWSVSDDASWVTITKTAGSSWIDVSWEANPSTTPRDAHLTVTGIGELTNSETVTLTQAGAPASLDISPNSLTVHPESGSSTFSMSSNVGWSVSDDATWLTATKTDGSTITVSYDTNTSTSVRTAHITATGTGGVTETVNLYQEDGHISFNGPPQNVSAEAGSQGSEVSTSISEWSISDDAAWVTITRTAGTNFIDVGWEANTSSSPREARITAIGTGEITNSASFTLTQAGAPASIDVSPDSKDVGPESGSTTFRVTSTVGWSVSDDASWLTATKTDGSTITVSFDSFSSTQNRTANITVSGTGGLTETVTFTQIGAPILEVDPNSYEIGAHRDMLNIVFSTNIDWTVSDDASWLEAVRDGKNYMLVFVSNNPTTIPRTTTITVAGTGGPSETINITQAGLVPTLFIFETEINVEAESGTRLNFIDSNSQLWTASTGASWLTVNRINQDRVDFTYEANPSTIPRSASITVDATGGVTGSFTVNQAGAEAFLDVSPNTRTVDAQSYHTTLQVSSTVGWSVSDDANWLTATKIDGSNIYLDYPNNFHTIPRTANITVIGTGGLSETVTLTQEAGAFYANFNPESFSVDATSGTVSFEVTSNADWSTTADATWLSVEKTDENTISVSYEANDTEKPRIGIITVEGPGGVTETATVTQASETITMDVSPKSKSVDPASGTSTFDVNSNIDWTVSDDASWLTVTKTDGTTITADYETNTTISARSAQITVEGTGGITEIVTITQEGETAILEVSPDSKSVDAASGTSDINVNSNVEWSVSDETSWLTASKTDVSTISISYETNTSTDQRTALITVSGGGITESVIFTQAGLVASLEVSPADKSVDAASGAFSINVQANVEWTVTDDASWLTATGTDVTTINVSYEANSGLPPRTANILIEGSGGVSETVTVTQASETITFYVSPKSQEVDAASGNISFGIDSNIEWDVSYDVSWLTAEKADDSTINVSYDSNPEFNPRTGYIIVAGAGDISEIISITQAGEALYLNLASFSRIVGSESDSSSILVASNVDWLVSEEADWLSMERSGDSLLMVYFEKNTSTEKRSAEITFYGEGVISLTFTIEQEGSPNTGFVDQEGPVNFTVYPNPAKHSIFIRPGKDIDSEVLISLFDGSGKMLYNSSEDRISANEIMSIDISGYHPGIYLLRLSHSGKFITKKVVIR